MPRYLSQETHDSIIELHKQGMNFTAIGKELGIAVSTVSNIVKKEVPIEERLPPIPSGFSGLEQAYSICNACSALGFESAAVGEMCRHFRVDIREVKDLARWFANNCSVHNNETVKELKAEVRSRDRLIDQLASEKVESDEVLAYLAKENVKQQIRDRIQKLEDDLSKEKNKVRLLKKVYAVKTELLHYKAT